jgi:hypothetical protein
MPDTTAPSQSRLHPEVFSEQPRTESAATGRLITFGYWPLSVVRGSVLGEEQPDLLYGMSPG